ncbi:MAG: sigma-70 family RNA polymerase sigma factor [Oscillospiraceae bacterium]|nr:sigma-70 family RNA polymerase sigma factor [Oscillospiraceae bacterium]
MRDAELLELLQKNPEKGLKALIVQYGGLVYTVVRRNLPEALCTADAEACAAEVFSDFYLDLNKYDPSKGSIKAWICVIARHNAIDLTRRNTEVLPLDEEIRADIGGISLESDLEERELRCAVLSGVKSLNEPDREILLRKFYLGESSKEIAARLKMSVSNVDTRTSRAVEKLRKKLDDWRK